MSAEDYDGRELRLRAHNVRIVPRVQPKGGGRGLEMHNIGPAGDDEVIFGHRVVQFVRDMERAGIQDGDTIEFTAKIRSNKYFDDRYDLTDLRDFRVV